MSTHLPGNLSQDGFEYIWNIYIFWKEIFSKSNPFFTQYIFYPMGANLSFHTYAPLISFLSLPFLSNKLVFFNSLIIISFCLAAFSTYLLVYFLTKNQKAAFISGVIYGFSPIMYSFMISQHYYFIFAAYCLPLGFLILSKFFVTLKGRYLIYLSILFWICFLTEYQVTILLIILLFVTSMVTLLNFYSNKREKFDQIFNIRTILLCSKIFGALILIPTIVLFLMVFRLQDLSNLPNSQGNTYPYFCNANVLGYFTPNSEYIYSILNFSRSSDTPSYYIGISFLTAALLTFRKFHKRYYVASLGVTGIVIFCLSLGNVIRFGSVETVYQAMTPYFWFSQIPFLGMLDCPIRFPILVQMVIAVLTGVFLSELMKKVYNLKFPLFFIFILVIYIEFHSSEIPLTKLEIPKVYTKLSQIDNQKTVLELPSGISEAKGSYGLDYEFTGLDLKQLYWQTIYDKPKIGGYISHAPDKIYYFLKAEPILSGILDMTSRDGKWAERRYSKEQIDQFINKFNIGYLVIAPDSRQELFKQVVEGLLKDRNYQFISEEGFLLYILE